MYRKSPVSWSKHLDFMVSDLLYLQIAFVFAYYLRNGSFHAYQDALYRMIAVFIGMVHISVAVFTESYTDVLRRGYMREFLAIAKHMLLVLIGEVGFLFFTKSGEAFSRLNVIYFAVCSVVILYVWHSIWKKVLVSDLFKNRDKRVLVLVADGKQAEAMLDHMKKQLMLDSMIRGIILTGSMEGIKKIQGIPVVAGIDTAEEFLENNVVDEVLFARSQEWELPGELVSKCEMMGLTVHIEIPESDLLPSGATIEQIFGIPVFSSCVKLVTGRQLIMKRIMDIAGGIVGLIITGIAAVFVIPAIYFSDPGPVIFSQQRVGKNGRTFRLYKFRSMYQDAEARKKELAAQNQIAGPMFKMDADPRIIGSGPDGRKRGIGWLIRTTSLDELPQFWNVLKGDMSLVGTRPPTLDEWEQYELHHRARMAIKPGLTGMWQVSGRSDILDFDEVVHLDTEYIRNWSVTLDIKILAKTVLVVFLRKGSR